MSEADSEFARAMADVGKEMERIATARNLALKVAVHALDSIARGEPGQGLRNEANVALREIAVALAS